MKSFLFFPVIQNLNFLILTLKINNSFYNSIWNNFLKIKGKKFNFLS